MSRVNARSFSTTVEREALAEREAIRGKLLARLKPQIKTALAGSGASHDLRCGPLCCWFFAGVRVPRCIHQPARKCVRSSPPTGDPQQLDPFDLLRNGWIDQQLSADRFQSKH